MTYRTIDVEGQTYEYVTSRTHTKIKGVGVFPNSEIGHRHAIRCECCGETLNELYGENPAHYALAVSPRDIRAQILKAKQ